MFNPFMNRRSVVRRKRRKDSGLIIAILFFALFLLVLFAPLWIVVLIIALSVIGIILLNKQC
ncbi:MAG: hypothetical protein RRY79_06205 [Clostridia bacterium]